MSNQEKRERDIQDEIQHHLETEQEELRASGLSESEARAAARRGLGNPAMLEENLRDLWIARWWREFLQDIRYGLRGFRKDPGFMLAAVLCLALGTGAATTVASIANASLFRALPYPEPSQLVVLSEQRPRENVTNNTVSLADFLDWRERNRVFANIATFSEISITYTSANEPQRLEGALVSSGYFGILGVSPRLGRDFAREDEKPGTAIAIVSDSFWKRNLQGRDDALGLSVNLNGNLYTLVGVLPPDFRPPDHAWDVYVPLTIGQLRGNERGFHSYYAIGRTKPGITLAAARQEMDRISKDLAKEYPIFNAVHAAYVKPLSEYLRGDFRGPTMALLGAAGLVMLIACFNVANLLLARAVSRAREISVRLALGAGRLRIARQLLTESLVLAVTGTAAGVVLAFAGVALVRAILPAYPALAANEIRVDRTVLAIASILALSSGILFGLAPAFTGAWTGVHRAMQAAGRNQSGSAGRSWMRSAIVAGESAFAVMLLAGAGLLLRSFWTLQSVDTGFRADQVLTLQVALPDTYDATRQVAFRSEMLQRVRTLPGVVNAGMTSFLPVTGQNSRLGFEVENVEADPKKDPRRANWRLVTPGYFETMQIPLRAGRTIAATDTTETPLAIWINETAARQYWPGRDPLGTRAKLSIMEGWAIVAGVVGDVKHFGPDRPAVPEAYFAFNQSPTTALALQNLVVRTQSDPETLMSAVRQELRGVDRNLPPLALRTMEDVMQASYAPRRFLTLLVVGFAALALILAAGGIYAQLAYAVSQRRQEVGVRMALGAQRSHVVTMILRQGLTVTVVGLALGLAGVVALAKFIQQVLFGVEALDTRAVLAAPVLLLVVAAIACAIPAWKASKADPALTLRHE